MLCDWVSNYLKPSKNQTKCTLNPNFSAVFESWPMRSLVVTMKKVDIPSCIAVYLVLSFLCGSLLKRDVMLTMSRAWDKEKKLSPRDDSNLSPSARRSDALTTELRETSGDI